MGNNQSNNSRPPSASPSGSNHGIAPARSRERGEPRIRDSLRDQRVAAPPEPSTIQARGTSVSHRSRPTTQQNIPHSVRFEENSSPASKGTPPKSEKLEKIAPKADVKDEPSKPVAVPATAHGTHTEPSSLKSPYDFGQLASGDPMDDPLSYGGYVRPPRLPLPIEEEIHTPGSPIIAPSDPNTGVLSVEELDNEALPRRTSGLSAATNDEGSDDEELPIDKTKASVPVEFTWNSGGAKIYVTGSIFQWSRKAKLHPVPGQEGHFKATLYVRPGTHHVRFIVDNDMTVSTELPTTVDFGNNLVNYIEVSADDVPKEPVEPAKITAMGTPVIGDEKKLETPAKDDGTADESKPKKMKPVDPNEKYTSFIPQYLVDLDKAEDSQAYQHAAAAIEKLPTPPSLPGFLGKPILNALTPLKDDNSVLNMPNHTVLNHLATSSIKNNVLAVSATTRYKAKYVTTIMYKPTSDDS